MKNWRRRGCWKDEKKAEEYGVKRMTNGCYLRCFRETGGSAVISMRAKKTSQTRI